MNPIATAVLLNYKRPHRVIEIAERLAKLPEIGEVVVRDNSGSDAFGAFRFWNLGSESLSEFHRLDVDNFVLGDESNSGVWGRWLASMRANYPLVYVQDDDCMVDNVQDLIAAARPTPARVESGERNRNAGEVIPPKPSLSEPPFIVSCNNRSTGQRVYPHEVMPGRCTWCVGWGACFPASLARSFVSWAQKLDLPDWFKREAMDRLFCAWTGVKPVILATDECVRDFPEATDPASSLSNAPGYADRVREAEGIIERVFVAC